jgi:hypothetical protein
VRYGLEFTIIMMKSLPVRLQPIGSFGIDTQRSLSEQTFGFIDSRRGVGFLDRTSEFWINGERDGRAHIQQGPAASLASAREAARSIGHSDAVRIGVADRGKLPATAARGFAASCAVKGDCAEVIVRPFP